MGPPTKGFEAALASRHLCAPAAIVRLQPGNSEEQVEKVGYLVKVS